ncbi:MAG: hypothetical protein IJJ15_03620 [Ruminococcus sp.]|nr:hypothetical protein [Ruminococcus sp.]
MDNLTEQVVKVKKTAKYYINIILIIFFTIAIPAGVIVLAEVFQRAYLIYIAFFTLIGLIFLAWYLITSMNYEFEYALLGSSFGIDKIIAKRRRRKMLKLDIKEINEFIKYSDKEMTKRKFSKIYELAGERFSEKNYIACFHSEAKGNCALIFSPNDKMLQAMKPFFKQEIALKIYKEKLF